MLFWLNKPFFMIGKAEGQTGDPNAVGSSMQIVCSGCSN